jgi:hypothetical protein
MKSKFKFKCLNCNQIHFADPRNHAHQRYCKAPDCKKASKAESQRRWAAKAENQNYFRGAENCERVREWRKAHPGYSRKKKPIEADALQDLLNLQDPVEEAVASIATEPPCGPLQDICFTQPALFVGLISILTGQALQEDIAETTRRFLTRGEDILRMTPQESSIPIHENQTPSAPRPFAACAASI